MTLPILAITCPSGKQCTHLIPLLYNKGHFNLRLAAHSEASASRLKTQYPDAEIYTTDLSSQTSCLELVKGVTSIYHVGPSFHSREKEMGFNMIDAAIQESVREGNVFKHFVFSSVLNTQHRNLIQHDLKSYIEERLRLSPLSSWTILKPTNFMDAYPVQMFANQEHPVMEKLWKPEIPNSVVALRDLAEAACKVLVQGPEKHTFAEYPLCSTMPVSDADIVQAISRAIGKEIEIKTPSFERGVEKVMGYLFGNQETGTANLYAGAGYEDFRLSAEGDSRGDLCRDEAERLGLFYNRRGLKGSPTVLKWLLEREPTSVDEWIQRQLKGDDPILKTTASSVNKG